MVALGGFITGAAKKGSELMSEERANDARRAELAEKYKQDLQATMAKLAVENEFDSQKEKTKRVETERLSSLENDAYTRISAGEDFGAVASDPKYTGITIDPTKVANVQKLNPEAYGKFQATADITKAKEVENSLIQAGFTPEQARERAYPTKKGDSTTIYTGDAPEVATKKMRETWTTELIGFRDLGNEVDRLEQVSFAVGGAPREAINNISGFFRGLSTSSTVLFGDTFAAEAATKLGQMFESDEQRAAFQGFTSTIGSLGSAMKELSGESGTMTENDIKRMYSIIGKSNFSDPLSVQAGINEVRRMIYQKATSRLEVIHRTNPADFSKDELEAYKAEYAQKFAAKPKTEGEFNRLPNGVPFISPEDGLVYIKP